MGFCERKILLKHQHGTRVAAKRRARQANGNAEHRRFLAEALMEEPGAISDSRMLASAPGVIFCILSRIVARLRQALG
jgi:hypothetical protein